MKLQLNENTLNAYINEAIRQELNEDYKGKLAKFFTNIGKKLGDRAAKKSAPAVQKSGEAFGNLGKSNGPLAFKHNSERVQATRKALRGANSKSGAKFTTGVSKKTMNGEKLEYVVKKQDGKIQYFAKDGKTPLAGNQLNLARDNFRKRSAQYKDIRKMGNLNRGIALTAVAGGVGTAIAASGSRNPDAPWNDTPTQGKPNNNQSSGFDGTFPWDNTTPNWTPRRPKPTTPTPSPEETPAQPERPKIEPLVPVQTPANIPTGVTAPEQPGIIMRQPQQSLAQSAVRVMGQTANQSNMGLRDRISTNRRTRQNANNAIDQMVRDGSMTRQQARDDKKLMKGAEKALRTGKPMN